ncbi:MAG: hypothetical protein AABY83_11145 [Pseudomonadota bacterium]
MYCNRSMVLLGAATAFLVMAGCGGKSAAPAKNSPQLSGVVAAPGNATTGGAIATYKPGFVDRMLALFVGGHANAGFSGLYGVSGVAVNLIKIDAAGAQVGAALATASTDSGGAYSIALPDNFAPSAEYVLRATQNGTSIDAVVASTDNDIDVNPVSDAARQLLTTKVSAAGTTLASLKADAVSEMIDTVIQAARGTDLTNDLTGATLTTTSGYVAAIQTAVTNNDEAANAVNSVASPASICGTVTNLLGAAVPRILIVVRRYADWVLQASTLTDANGAYCLNVPAGDYIVGANNHKILGFAASEWYTNGGGDVKRKKADKVTVSTGTLTKDFVLSPGGRIAGRVIAQDTGDPLPGVEVAVHDWDTNAVTFSVKTDIYGYYRLNLPTGNYRLALRNHTLQAYASEYWNDTLDGGLTRGFAKKIAVTDGAVNTANFDLLPGRPVFGVVQDGAGVAVPGTPVDIRDAASFVTTVNLRTNKVGRFRIQLYKGLYTVIARGKQTAADIRDVASQVTINTYANAQPIAVTDGTNPLSDVKVILRTGTGGYISSDTTDSLGNATVFASATNATAKLVARIDDGTVYATQVYNGVYNAVNGGTSVPMSVAGSNATNAGVTMTLANTANIVTGRVTFASGAATFPVPNATVQLLDGTNTANTFETVQADNDGYYQMSLYTGQAYAARVRLINDVTAWTAITTPITVGTTNTLNVSLDTAMGPPMPLGVYAEQGATGTIVLHWKPVENMATYNIYQSTTAGFTPSGIAAAISTGTTATISGLTTGTTYYFRVASVDPNSATTISKTYTLNEVSILAP